MQRLCSAFALLFVLNAATAVRADMAPGSRHVPTAIRIDNLEDYPNLTFYVLDLGNVKEGPKEVRPGEAVPVRYDFFRILAVPRGQPLPKVGDLSTEEYQTRFGVFSSVPQITRMRAMPYQTVDHCVLPVRVLVKEGSPSIAVTHLPVEKTHDPERVVAVGVALTSVCVAAGLFVVWFVRRRRRLKAAGRISPPAGPAPVKVTS
jgi:hypothetical protein